MCEHTLEFLCASAIDASSSQGQVAGEPPTLLELYCGNGNHTVALAKHFKRILAVEIDRRLCSAAEHNLAANGVTNASVLCASSGKFCGRLLSSLKRAKAGACDQRALVSCTKPEDVWLREAQQRTDVILVDPPRWGLDAETLQLVSHFDHILYISCNPNALRTNLDAALATTHEVRRWAVFDHFAYTPHLECGVHLVRRAR